MSDFLGGLFLGALLGCGGGDSQESQEPAKMDKCHYPVTCAKKKEDVFSHESISLSKGEYGEIFSHGLVALYGAIKATKISGNPVEILGTIECEDIFSHKSISIRASGKVSKRIFSHGAIKIDGDIECPDIFSHESLTLNGKHYLRQDLFSTELHDCGG